MLFTPHPVTLRQLQYIAAIAELGSFRRAADACRVAQPSLSAQVAHVEELLGVRLFVRDHRQVALTPAGQALLARVRGLLGDADVLFEAARSLADPLAGTLRLGVIPTVGPYLLPDVAPALRRSFPRLTPIWTEERTATLIEFLQRSELDAAVLALEAGLAGLAHVVLGRDEFWFASAPNHPLAAASGPMEPELLAGERVLLLDDGHCFRDQALSYCNAMRAEEASYRATSLSTLVQMAASGVGVTLLPRLAIDVENRRDTLCLRPFTRPPTRTLALAWRAGSALEATLNAVGAVLRGACAILLPCPSDTT